MASSDELRCVSGKTLEFGYIPYSIGMQSSILPLTIQNTTNKYFQLNLFLKSGDETDFPVRLIIGQDDDKVPSMSSLRKSISMKSLSNHSGGIQDASVENNNAGLDNRSRSSSLSKFNSMVVKPLSTVTLKAQLTIVPESINSINLRTSFFNVIGKCKLKYREIICPEQTGNPVPNFDLEYARTVDIQGETCFKLKSDIGLIEFVYSASLCTSVMHLDVKEIIFNECAIGQWYVQEIMVWNRSECALEFMINRKLLSENDFKQQSLEMAQIKFFDGENGNELPPGRVVQVPAFAPKVIVLKVIAKTLGPFRFYFEATNINNRSNNLTLDIVGHAVKDRKHYLDNCMIHDPDTSSDWCCSNSVLNLNLGDWSCGKSKIRSFWFVNNNSHDLDIAIGVTGDDGNEIQIHCDGDQQQSAPFLEDVFDVQNPPSTKLEAIKKVGKATKFDANTLGGNSFPEAEVLFLADFKEDQTCSKFCGQWFGNEYVDSEVSGNRAYELQAEFGVDCSEPLCDFRPFMLVMNAIKKSKATRSSDGHIEESQILSQFSSQIGASESAANIGLVKCTLPGKGRRRLTLEVTPSQEHQRLRADDKYSLMERNITLNISFAGDVDATTKVNVNYRSCISEFVLTPPEYNVGLCNIGEAYPFTIIVANMCNLPMLVKPFCSLDSNDLDVPTVSLDSLESKEVTLVFTPTKEMNDYHNSITFENMDNNQNSHVLKVLGRAVDTEHAQIHDLFYKILDSESHNQSQLQFGKTLAHMVNFSIFRLKNISSGPLQVDFHGNNDSSLEVFIFERLRSKNISGGADSSGKAVSAPFSSGTSFPSSDDKNSSSQDHSSRIVELEELKWGSKKMKSNSARLSLDDDPDTRLRISNKARSVEKGEISQSLNALDILPSPSTSKFHGNSSLGINQSLLLSPLKPVRSIILPSYPSDVVEHGNPSPALVGNASTSLFTSLQELIKVMQNQLFPRIFDESYSDEVSPTRVEREDSNVNPSNVLDVNTDHVPQSQPSHQESTFLQLLQETYKTVDMMLGGLRKVTSGGGLSKKNSTIIPQDSSVHVVVVWRPNASSDGKFFDIAAGGNQLRDYLQIGLPSVTKELIQLELNKVQGDHVDQQVQCKFDELFYRDLQGLPFLLPPRSLLARCECFRSEMTIVQKNINYGRVVVGDSSVRPLTIINKSPVACIYSFSKSGNISSGFVTIVDGRKGIIQPFSSKTIQIAFKPTMPSTFEEVIQIRNLLNPFDEHSLIIKAKVSRTESFSLTIVDESSATPIVSASHLVVDEDLVNMNEEFKCLLKSISSDRPAGDVRNESVQQNGSSNQKLKNEVIFVGGMSAVGKSPTVTVKLKIRNPTNKRRQFIFDSSSKDSITLLDKSLLRRHHQLHSGGAEASISSNFSVLENLLDQYSTFVIPIPEYLENVLIGRCIVHSEVLKSGASMQEVDEDLIQSLMDNLEKFQQKLKIAIRKAKPDKIVKYQKKIDDTIKQLSGANSSAGGSISNDRICDISASESNPVRSVNDADFSQYLFVEPDEERLVTLKISYLPGTQYKSWKGLLPFIGKIRVFEVKNEDIVKTLYLGMGLFSSVACMESPTGEDGFHDSAVSLVNAPDDSVNKEFMVVIPLWSLLQSDQITSKYKRNPILNVSVKLSRWSQAPNFSGKFSVSAISNQPAKYKISLESMLDHSQSFQLYDDSWGELNLVSTEESSMVTMSDTDDRLLKGWGNEKVVDRKILSHKLTKDKDYEFVLKPGGAKEFSLVWSPPMLNENLNEEFRLLGAIKLVFTSMTLTRSLVIPFICVYQRNSIIKADKQVLVEKVAVGSYITAELCIKNDSKNNRSLNYQLVFEKLSEKNSSRGYLEILHGKAGRIGVEKSQSVKLKFHAFSAGRFEQKIWIQNMNDSFDQRRVVFNANIVFAQNTFVEFPDLTLATDTGKYKPIDFGKLQIRSQEFDVESFNASMRMALQTPFELKIRNVSNQVLSLTPVPNLRNQCFVFSDRECIEQAIDMKVHPNEDTILYILLKPTDLEKFKKNPLNSGVGDDIIPGLNDNERNCARELAGGIRLVFFADRSPDAQWPNMEERKGENYHEGLFRTKLFETAISFTAIVGRSYLTAALVDECDGILLVNAYRPCDIEFGTLKIFNQSDIFPLHYAFYDDPHVTFDIGNLHIEPKISEVKLVFQCEKSGRLNPLEEKAVQFYIVVGADVKGFFTKSIRICNLDTNEITEVCLALYIEANKIRATLKTEENDVYESMSSSRSPPILHIARPFWLKYIDSASTTPTASQFEIINNDERSIGSVILRNVSISSITLIPMSDLPVKILMEIQDENVPDKSTSNHSLPGIKSKTSISGDNEPSNPSAKLRRRFRKCGEAFSLRPNEVVVARIYRATGVLYSEMSKLLDFRKLLKQNALVIQGSLCFLERMNVLQSMFMPPTISQDQSSTSAVKSSTENGFSGNDFSITSDYDYSLPVLSVTGLNCKFILPKLRIKPLEVDLGRIRLRSNQSFEFSVSCSSEQDALCIIDGVPIWMLLTPSFSGKESIYVQSADFSKILFYCRSKSTVSWQGTLTEIPVNVKAGVNLVISPLPSSLEEFARDGCGESDTKEKLQRIIELSSLKELHLNPQILGVKFKIDRRSPLEISAISNEKLISILPADSKVNTSKSISTLFRYNFLRSFLIPPSSIVEVNEPVQDFVGFYENMAVKCHINDTAVKQGCKLSVKNIFDCPLRVSLNFDFIHSDILNRLIDITCKFEHTTSSFVELLPDESVQIRIRAIPKAYASIDHNILEKIDALSLIDFPVESQKSLQRDIIHNQTTQRIDTATSSDEGLANALLKLRSRPCILGKLYLRPSLDDLTAAPENAHNGNDMVYGLSSQSMVPSTLSSSSISLTDADGICIDVVGALKFGPTTRVIHPEEMLNSPIHSQLLTGNTLSHEIIGGLILNYECDNILETSKSIGSVNGDDGQQYLRNKACDGIFLTSSTKLLVDEHSFYVANPSRETIEFKIQSLPYRYPGARITFNVDQDIFYWTDTLLMEVTPSEGCISPGCAMRFCARVVPGNPSDASIINERLPGKEFHTHSSSVQKENGEIEQLMLCLPIEIWDKNFPLHPPSIVYAHIVSKSYIPSIRSQPISDINRQKQHLDMAWLRAEEAQEDVEQKTVLNVESTEKISDNTVTNNSQVPRTPDKPISPSKNIAESSTVDTPPHIEFVPTSIMHTDSDGFISRDFFIDGTSPQIVCSPSRKMRLRGVTPHSHLNNFSYVEFGRQIQRQEYIEWVVTIENTSKSQALHFTIESYHIPSNKKTGNNSAWVRLGQNGGLIPANGQLTHHPTSSASIMLYFNRGNVGIFCSFFVIRDLLSNEHHIIRASMQVTSDDWRKRSTVGSIVSPPSLDGKLALSWLIEYCNMVFVSHDDNLFALSGEKTRSFVLKTLTHPMYKLQHLEIGCVKWVNRTSVSLDFSLTVSTKWMNVVINYGGDNGSGDRQKLVSKVTFGGNTVLSLSPQQELTLNVNINPSIYKNAMARGTIDSELLNASEYSVLSTKQLEEKDNKVAARVVGTIVCTCRTLDGLKALIPIHELVK